MIKEQEKKNYNNTFYKKVHKITEKPTWKKEVKESYIKGEKENE